MPAYTFYHQGSLESGSCLTLSPEESHHLLRVMRLKKGDTLELLNGCGTLAAAKVKESSKIATVEIERIIRSEPCSPFTLEIVQGMPGLNKADLIVEKLTELGVTAISFVATERSVKQVIHKHQLEKLKLRMVAAIKQSGNLWLPTLHFYPNLQAFKPATETVLLTLDPRGKRLSNLESNMKSSLTAFIGPESGFSEKEQSYLASQGALLVSIHPHTLRAETAAIAAAGLLHSKLST